MTALNDPSPERAGLVNFAPPAMLEAGKRVDKLGERAFLTKPFTTDTQASKLTMPIGLQFDASVFYGDKLKLGGAVRLYFAETLFCVASVANLHEAIRYRTNVINAHAARRSSKMESSAPCSAISLASVGCDLLCFQREGVVGATPARSQIAIMETREASALSNKCAKGSCLSMVRHSIGGSA